MPVNELLFLGHNGFLVLKVTSFDKNHKTLQCFLHEIISYFQDYIQVYILTLFFESLILNLKPA